MYYRIRMYVPLMDLVPGYLRSKVLPGSTVSVHLHVQMYYSTVGTRLIVPHKSEWYDNGTALDNVRSYR